MDLKLFCPGIHTKELGLLVRPKDQIAVARLEFLCCVGLLYVYTTCFQYMGSPYKRSISSLGTTRHTIQQFLICYHNYFVLMYVWL